jgi:glyoxylase-like metal-dependent hydrolase (beta-lactamase superfamily II)
MLTHMHADHTGLVTRLAAEESRIFFSRIDARVFDPDNSWQPLVDFAAINGFPADELEKALNSHPGFKYSPEKKPVFTLIDDGDVIACGDYRLKCMRRRATRRDTSACMRRTGRSFFPATTFFRHYAAH